MTRPLVLCLWIFGWSGLARPASAQAPSDTEASPRVHYLAAGGDGDGRSAATPFGSTAEAEAASSDGDIIVLLPGTGRLDGGLVLKPYQTLRGVVRAGRAPVITNTKDDRNGGIGVVLASGVRIRGVEVRDTRSSGIFGHDVADIALSDVVVANANTSRALVEADPLAPFPHGGITFTTSPDAGERVARLARVRVIDAAGMGVGTAASAGARVTLSLQDVEVTGGAGIGNADFGVAAVAMGVEASATLEMVRSSVSGRRTLAARNVALGAGDHGATRALIYESRIGASGQDGVLAATAGLPATLEVEIVGSTIEDAAQSNIEGTMLALPHEEVDALASRIAISIHRSTVRNAGSGPLFADAGSNVLMTGSFIPPGLPLAAGQYTLRVTDSDIEGGSAFGVALGTLATDPTADPGRFEVVLRGNRFSGNGRGDIRVGAPQATVDARGNCWSRAEGGDARVATAWLVGAAAVDTSRTAAVDTAHAARCERR